MSKFDMMVSRGHQPRTYTSQIRGDNRSRGNYHEVPTRCRLTHDEQLSLVALLGSLLPRRLRDGAQQQASQDRCTQCTRLRSNPKCVCEVAEHSPANGMGRGVPSTKPVAMLTIRVLLWARWRRWRKPRALAAEKIATAWRKHRDVVANKIIKFWKNCRMGVRLAALSTQFRTLTAERLEHAARVIQAWWKVRGDIFCDTCCVCYEEKVERILTTTTNKVVSVWVENPCGHKLCRRCAYLCAKRSSKCVLCRRVIEMNFVPSSTPPLDGTGALIMKPIGEKSGCFWTKSKREPS
mmetsp:Transcript_8129/g.14734  ORF Transcript_8129/g.14734 Transcript_8129/m.14734 type:complete len:294 (+) Transcript_8129:42-923(+)